MRDELERSRTRLQLPGVDKPFYIEYRLLDVDVRSVTASFGALLASDTARSRFMSVDVRVGDYHLDSSNFISEDGFRGFPWFHRARWASTATTIRCARIFGSPPTRPTKRP